MSLGALQIAHITSLFTLKNTYGILQTSICGSASADSIFSYVFMPALAHH